MLGPSWILCGLLLCLIEPSLQKGVPPRANGGLGQMMLPAMMRGAGTQPGRGVGPMVSKGIGPRMMLNGYGMARGQQLAAGAMGNGGKAPKPQGYRSSDGFPRGPLPMGVPAGLGMKRKPGYGVPRNGYPTVYQNGYRNGQAGQRLAFRGKQGKVPGYTNGVGSRTAPAMVQPAYANGYRNGYINGYGPGYGNGVPNGYAGSTGYTNGAGLQPGAGGKGLGPTGYGGTAGLPNGYGGAAGLTNGYGGAAGLTNGYGGAAGLTNGAGLQPGAGGKGLGPTGYGGAAGLTNGYGGAAGLTNGAALQPGAGGKGLGPTGYGGTAGLPNGYGGAAGLTNGYGAGSIPSAVAYPGIQMAAGYGNGYPSVLADGMAYGLKPGKQLGQDLYGAQHLQANGQSVDATAAKYGGAPQQPYSPQAMAPSGPDDKAARYGTGLPYNGQPFIPAGLGTGPLTYEIPQQAVRMVPDPAAVKYANGFLGTGLPQAMPAGGNGQYGLGPGPAQQLGAKDGKYAGNGYYGNGYGGCPSGKCNRQGKK